MLAIHIQNTKLNIMKHYSFKSVFTVLLLFICIMADAKSSQLNSCRQSYAYEQSNTESTQNGKKSIKILCFGNSLTQDSFGYVPFILKNIAPDVDVTIGIAYKSGCSLQQHYANFINKDTIIDNRNINVTNYLFYKSVNSSAWVYNSKSADEILTDDDWDIVTFQQSSGYATRDYNKYYEPYISKLHKILLNKLNRDVKIAWNLIHGANSRDGATLLNNWQKVVENTEKVEKNTNTTIIFPYGTAVQNLRTLDFINNYGDTGFLLADTGHLQEGLGCLAAAYANSIIILNAIGIYDVSVIGDNTNISLSFVLKNKIPGTHLGDSRSVVGINNVNRYLAQVAATKAVEKPYKITELLNYVPDHNLIISSAGYATMYLDKAVEIPTGVEAYTAGRIEGDYLKMQAVEDVIPANTAVIIKAEEGNYSFAYSDETPDAIEGNLLRGTLTDTYIKPAGAQSAYVLSVVDGVVGMYRAKLKADGTFKNNANRVYMLLGEINVGEGDLDTSSPGGQLSNGYRFDFSGTTAIESVETESAAPAVYYDLSGRRVQNPTKGIYIVNGRKVFIK